MTLDFTTPLSITWRAWAERRRLAALHRARHAADAQVKRATRSFVAGS